MIEVESMSKEDFSRLKEKVVRYKSTVAELEEADKALRSYRLDREQVVKVADAAVLKNDLDAFREAREKYDAIDLLISMAESRVKLIQSDAARQILDIIESIDQIA